MMLMKQRNGQRSGQRFFLSAPHATTVLTSHAAASVFPYAAAAAPQAAAPIATKAATAAAASNFQVRTSPGLPDANNLAVVAALAGAAAAAPQIGFPGASRVAGAAFVAPEAAIGTLATACSVSWWLQLRSRLRLRRRGRL